MRQGVSPEKREDMETQPTSKQDFFAKAKEAEQAAQDAVNPKVKDAWTKVAQNYRDLAAQAPD